MKEGSGFSLTEVLAVVAILLILATLFIVSLSDVYTAAQLLKCQQRLEQIDKACRMFSTQHDGRELRALDRLDNTSSGRWYEKLLPYFDCNEVEEARRHLNCPCADLVETSGEAGGARRSLALPVLVYRTYDSTSYGTYHNLRDDFRASDTFPGGADYVAFKDGNDAPLWNGGLEKYCQFWMFSFSEGRLDAFNPATPDGRDPEILRVFRERDGGGLFMCGDHSGWTQSNPQEHYGMWNTSLNAVSDHCKLGICLRSARCHNDCVQSTGHFVGNGLTTLPRGSVWRSVGSVAKDSRKNDERIQRHKFVTFPLLCRGPQIEGASGPWSPAGVHAEMYDEPCAVCGAMDDGLGRVFIDNTFTRWGTSDYSYHRTAMWAYAEQIGLWLGGGHGMRGDITYGYNNQIGHGPDGRGLGPSVSEARYTIRVLDYKFYAADHDAHTADNDDITCIAPRHGGRANVLFADGHCEALRPECIIDPGRDYWSVLKK